MASGTPGPNAGQSEHWNSNEARRWVTEQDGYDRMLAPFATALLGAVDPATDTRVLDVGCGTGLTTCEAARVATAGRAHGLDISRAMVDGARVRAAEARLTNVTFAVGDAQTEDFAADVDVVISRFGVMFFDDPVRAFANIRTALAPSGRLVFVCWQALAENAWMMVPVAAAARHVSLPDSASVDGPGPFSLGDRERVHAVLNAAGFSGIGVEPTTASILLGGGGTLDEAVAFLRATGVARALFADVPEATVERAVAEIATAVEPYMTPDGARLDAAAWVVTADAG